MILTTLTAVIVSLLAALLFAAAATATAAFWASSTPAPAHPDGCSTLIIYEDSAVACGTVKT